MPETVQWNQWALGIMELNEMSPSDNGLKLMQKILDTGIFRHGTLRGNFISMYRYV